LDYDAARARTGNPSLLGGDPALASELWLDGSDTTQTAADPTSLLRAVRDASVHGAKVRAAYVPDAELGTRWFADKAFWVRDGQAYRPFGTAAGAHRYLAAHPGSVATNYQQALEGSV
jgi:NitT/TauT family transport system substrate-binding protein